MSDIIADSDTANTTNESESDISWNSLCNEIDSLKRPSEISIFKASSTTDEDNKNIVDSKQNDDDDNCDNRDQNLSRCMKPSTSEMDDDNDDDKENSEIVDETLLPKKLQGKKWIIKNILGEVSQAYADGILLAIRRRHFDDYKNVFTTTCRREIEREYQTCRKHVIDVLSKIGDHDNIATFFGFRRIGFRWEMFIEYAGGGDLFDEIMNYVANKKRISDEVILARFSDLIRAIAYLHERTLKLSDFDCAVIFDDSTKVSPHQIGTNAYAPPQRFYTSTKPQCADIWSCGIILYLLLACEMPWIAAYKGDPCYDKWYEYINKKREPINQTVSVQ